jgi:RND family efflux transporter MFP subunit
LIDRRGLVLPAAVEAGKLTAGYHVAYPIEAVGKLRGVVVLHVGPRSEAELQAALRHLHWGAAGLEVLFAREIIARETAAKQRLQTVLELTAGAAGQERFSASAMALATELADRLHCERVSIGFVRGGRAKLDAVSHSAHFKERTNLLRAVSKCMDEAVDQGAAVAFPPIEGMLPAVTRAHEELAQSQGVDAILTVPIAAAGRVVGAMTLERSAERPFDLAAVELCEALAGLAGPMLDVHRREDQLMLVRAGWWGRDLLTRLFGPRHLGLKLGALIVAAVLGFLVFVQGDFRVSATSALEPLVQQAAVAPFNGYIREAPVRAGDVVKAGDLLAVLDDRELKLERLKWLGQQEEVLKQLRQAMADHNSSQVQVLSAQLEQNQAQLARVEDQLSRTRISAPFEGVVVSGDLTQQLGAPVERGTVLFEVAPMSSYRLVLKVDERDISHVQAGQQGNILLSAFPHTPIPFEVQKITPVSTPKEGRNFFRVEAKFANADPRLRPGMEGVGKIEIDRRSWLWIWTHDIWESIRLHLWKWLP